MPELLTKINNYANTENLFCLSFPFADVDGAGTEKGIYTSTGTATKK